MNKKIKIKFTDFECNLLVNSMNEFRNMLLSEGLPTEDVNELLLKIIDKREKQVGCYYVKQNTVPSGWRLQYCEPHAPVRRDKYQAWKMGYAT